MIIAFEGMDGSGKTLMATWLSAYLTATGVKNVYLREPGGLPVCEEIRKVIMGYNTRPMTDVLLFNAARHELVEDVIKPQLKMGYVIILDRYYYSTLAYQGAQGVSEDDINTVIDLAVGQYRPDITFFLDIDIQEGYKRKKGDDELQKFEERDYAYKKKVRDIYLSILEQDSDYCKIIDASKPKENVFWNIHNTLAVRHDELFFPSVT